jgi:hypothetical protein
MALHHAAIGLVRTGSTVLQDQADRRLAMRMGAAEISLPPDLHDLAPTLATDRRPIKAGNPHPRAVALNNWSIGHSNSMPMAMDS